MTDEELDLAAANGQRVCRKCRIHVDALTKHCQICRKVFSSFQWVGGSHLVLGFRLLHPAPLSNTPCTTTQCVTHFDHHCLYLNTCVGEKNYRAFFTLISALSLFELFQLYVTLDLAIR